MSRLDQLYKAMQTLNSEGLVLNEDLLNQVSELEEKIIKNEILPIIRETIEPAFGIKAKWISEDKKVKAEILGYTLIDPVSVIITHLSEIIKNHASFRPSDSLYHNLLRSLCCNSAEISWSYLILNDVAYFISVVDFLSFF